MKRILFAIFVIMIALVGCQSAPPTTPPPPPTATPTPLPPGITGVVLYTGTQKGGLLILAMNQPPKPNEPPQAVKGATFADVSSGEFVWDLPPATYYLIAFFTIGRTPTGPT
ncbi:MAG TPA: hypothetical protein VFF70_05545, partial [Anaerolineae bacterium]|nr:hypothetical protein [Anaerolineae bacterium]